MQTPPAFDQIAKPRTAGIAIASLVLGILAVTCFSVLAGIPALVLGIMALNRVNRSAGSLTGKGQSIAGIVMGGLSFVLLPVVLGILAGLLFPAVARVSTQAKTAKAQVEILTIKQAIQSYYNEYGKWPGQTAGGGDHHYTGPEYKQLLDMLQGRGDQKGAWSNPRQIVFLTFSESSIAKAAHGTAQPGEFADPWGNRYEIVADWNYDNRIDSPLADGGAAQGQGVAIWSYGPSGVNKANPADKRHLRSWH
jgi:type II secretory pathway pseudopilin PulG